MSVGRSALKIYKRVVGVGKSEFKVCKNAVDGVKSKDSLNGEKSL